MLRRFSMRTDSLGRARAATFLTFALGGLLCGVWVSRMPSMSGKFGIGPSEVGIVLLTWGLAAIVAMQGLRGVLARADSRVVLRVTSPLAALTAAFVALAPTYGLLLVAIALFGMAFGVMDVSMNAQGAAVERAYGRPVMSGMFAGWCVGAMSGGFFGSVTAALGYGFTPAVLAASLFTLPVALLLGPAYVADRPAPVRSSSGRRGRMPFVVYLIGGLAFIGFMAEGAIADWSGMLLRSDMRATEAVAALGYPLFEGAMLIGRLVGDRVRSRLGTRRLLIMAGLGTAGAMTLVVMAPSTPFALAGFLLTGAMVCTLSPTTMSLAGSAAPGRAAASVAQVGAMGYGGLLMGPVIIGFVSSSATLRIGLGLVIVLALAIAVTSRFLPIPRSGDIAALPVEREELEPELLAA
jgi:predicted MFS family arabinose efflux permease